MASAASETGGAAERRGLLLLAAAHGRSDIAGRALEEERRDPAGDLAALLAARADAQTLPGEDHQEGTPLHIACAAGHVDVVRLLLSRGARPDIRDAAGRTAFALAERSAKATALRPAFEGELFRRAAMGEEDGVEQMLAAGVDPRCKQGDQSLADWTQAFGHANLAERLRAAADAGAAVGGTALPAVNGTCSTPSADATAVERATPEAPRTSSERMLGEADGRSEAPSEDATDEDSPFPYVWPPLARSLSWPLRAARASDGTMAGEAVVLKLSADTVVHVELPYDMDVQEAGHFVDSLSVALRHAAGAAASAPSSGAVAGAPLVAPRFFCSWAEPGASDDGELVVRLSADPRQPLGTGGFRLCLLPARGGAAGGRVEVVAGRIADLRAGVEVLQQVFCHHGESTAAGQLCWPSAVLEDPSPAGAASFQLPPAVLLDVGKLRGPVWLSAMQCLKQWRVDRLYVPMEVPSRRAPAERARELQRIFSLRRAASARSLALVPVVTLDLAEFSQAASIVGELLPQFGPEGHLGIRLLPRRPSPEQPSGCEPALACVEQLLASVWGATEALLSCRGMMQSLWLPAECLVSEQLLDQVCRAVQGPLPLLLVLELTADAGGLRRARRALARAAHWGVSCCLFVDARDADASNTASSTPPLPPLTWPGHGVRGRASVLGRALERGRKAGARGAIMEVPTYGAPWCGPGVTGLRMWCVLTAFLAAGLGRTPSAALRALGLAEGDGAATEAPGPLGALLACQLLGAPGRSAASVGSLSAEVALALWDCEESTERPLPALYAALALLRGHLPLTGPEAGAATSVAAAWRTQLSRRRLLLKDLLQRLERGSAEAGDSWTAGTVPMMRAALLGVEWLLFACQLLQLISKHAPSCQGGHDGPLDLRALRAAIQSLPPAKGSDVRNAFLNLIERSVGGARQEAGGGTGAGPAEEEGPPVPDPAVVPAMEALWQDGVRVGAAMDLEPWATFERRQGL